MSPLPLYCAPVCSKLVVCCGDRRRDARAPAPIWELSAQIWAPLLSCSRTLTVMFAQVDEWEKHLQARPEQPVVPLNLGDIVVVKITRSSEFVYVFPPSSFSPSSSSPSPSYLISRFASSRCGDSR